LRISIITYSLSARAVPIWKASKAIHDVFPSPICQSINNTQHDNIIHLITAFSTNEVILARIRESRTCSPIFQPS
jgi:hypothetical protein